MLFWTADYFHLIPIYSSFLRRLQKFKENLKLKAWSFWLWKDDFCWLHNERDRAFQNSLIFFMYSVCLLYTFRRTYYIRDQNSSLQWSWSWRQFYSSNCENSTKFFIRQNFKFCCRHRCCDWGSLVTHSSLDHFIFCAKKHFKSTTR